MVKIEEELWKTEKPPTAYQLIEQKMVDQDKKIYQLELHIQSEIENYTKADSDLK
jgi:hypothetical protein